MSTRDEHHDPASGHDPDDAPDDIPDDASDDIPDDADTTGSEPNVGHDRTPSEGLHDDSRPDGGQDGSYVEAQHAGEDEPHHPDHDPGSYPESDRGDGPDDHGDYVERDAEPDD